MNERIKEIISEVWGIPPCKISDIFHWDREEKFAELIVQECIDILDDEDNEGPDGRSARIAAIRIKKLFGVKE
jgi:hypothetical protein